MHTTIKPFSTILELTIFCLLASSPSIAQVVPDRSLPVNSVVRSQGNTSTIVGGTTTGSNLFHSFAQFSVPTNGVIFFNNALNIQNIISRVTGQSISNINGLIRANGAANLFLINPNGIIFGPKASLRIGGSFLASTASSLNFADGTSFSATVPQSAPLLTISVPIGLQFGTNPGRILVQGDGQGIRQTSDLIDTTAGLRVRSNQTLGLIGGDVDLEGGTLKTAGGRIELGSVAGPSIVTLTPISKGWALGYEGVQNFKDTKLSQGAAVDASGVGNGDIRVWGRKVSLQDGSQIENSTLGSGTGGTLNVTASEQVELSGIGSDGSPTSLVSAVYPEAKGVGGNLIVKTGKLVIGNGAQVTTSTIGQGKGGDLFVNASNSVELSGTSSDGLHPSSLLTLVRGSGSAGNLRVDTRKLTLLDGAQVSASTYAQGNAGDLSVNASDSVEVTESVRNSNSPTGLLAESVSGATGNAGNLTITTRKLIVSGGQVETGTVTQGRAGDLFVNASDFVELSGVREGDTVNLSGLDSQSALGATGDAGSIKITTGKLIVGYGGVVSAITRSTGAAGNLTVTTGKLEVSGGQLQAVTTSEGRGGDLFVSASDSVELSGLAPERGPSSLLTLTQGSGTAGNITVDTGQLTIRDGAAISANSSGYGHGGNITVDANNLRVANGAVLSARTTGPGEAGNIKAQANILDIANGGQVLTNTLGTGDAGNINLNILSSIILSSSDPNYYERLTQLGTDRISNQSPASGIFANTSPSSTGNGGRIFIDPTNLTLTNGASIAVNSLGAGKAGDLNIQAGTVSLDRGSSITAATTSGENGNIGISSRDFRLQRGSYIDASALSGTKSGGNIALNTGTLELLDSSSIKANAYGGPGGNIQINTQGLFRSPNSAITASSQFGINGTVRINTPYIDFTRASANPVTPPQAPQVSSICSGRAGSTPGKVVNAGTGGTPPSSEDLLTSASGWHDNSMIPQSDENVRKQAPTNDQKPLQFVQAQGWIRRPNGIVSLVADPPGTPLSKLSSSPCYQQAQKNTAENK